MSCVVYLQDPVCTPDGFLFSKEAIIENLVQQKKAIKRKLAAWEAQQSDDQLKVSASAAHDILDHDWCLCCLEVMFCLQIVWRCPFNKHAVAVAEVFSLTESPPSPAFTIVSCA